MGFSVGNAAVLTFIFNYGEEIGVIFFEKAEKINLKNNLTSRLCSRQVESSASGSGLWGFKSHLY